MNMTDNAGVHLDSVGKTVLRHVSNRMPHQDEL